MTDHTTTIPPIDELTVPELGVLLHNSPSAASPHGHAAVQLLLSMADDTILSSRHVRRAFTISRGQMFIDWQAIADLGRSLLAGRIHNGPSYPEHPDAALALVLAAALATRQLTDSGINSMVDALNNVAEI